MVRHHQWCCPVSIAPYLDSSMEGQFCCMSVPDGQCRHIRRQNGGNREVRGSPWIACFPSPKRRRRRHFGPPICHVSPEDDPCNSHGLGTAGLSHLQGPARSVTPLVRPRTPVTLQTVTESPTTRARRRLAEGWANHHLARWSNACVAGTLWIEPVRLWGFRISASTTCATSTPACTLPKVSRSPWFQRGSGTSHRPSTVRL